MSDELSTSSFPDQCFYESNWPDFVTCTLCVDDCPVDRSLTSITKGLQIAQDNNHVINPVFSYNCDYFYDPDYNIAYEVSTGSATTNACNEPSCNGCTGSGANVCFQPTCESAILSQMTFVSNQTGGRVIDLSNLTTMDIDITNTIKQNIDQYALQIGEQKWELQRDVIETTQPLPNGQLVDIRLWVYKK